MILTFAKAAATKKYQMTHFASKANTTVSLKLAAKVIIVSFAGTPKRRACGAARRKGASTMHAKIVSAKIR